MAPMYVDGKPPLVGVTSVDASVAVTTPFIQRASGAHSIAVPDPTNNDTLAVLTSTQTLSSKTLLSPIIVGGSIASANLTQPVITGGAFTGPAINTPTLTAPTIAMTGGQMSGGIANYVVLGGRTVKTLAVGATKTLDFSTADIFIVPLTQATVLTVSNALPGKNYQVIVQQNIANGFTNMTWMSGFVNERLASGPTHRTAAVDFWNITFDGTYHYGMGSKDVQ